MSTTPRFRDLVGEGKADVMITETMEARRYAKGQS